MRALALLGCLFAGAIHAANPVPSIDYKLPFDETDARYDCDVTITSADTDWSDAYASAQGATICVDNDHGVAGRLWLGDFTNGGGAGLGAAVDISAVQITNPVQLDFATTHGWNTGDYIWCARDIGGTWQLRARFFRVTVVDTDSVTLDNQDATGGGTRPRWDAFVNGDPDSCHLWQPRVIRHTTDLTAHPVTLTEANKAKIREIECAAEAASGDDGPNHFMFWGLSTHHSGDSGFNGNSIRDCQYLVYDYMDMYDEDNIDNPAGDDVQELLEFLDGTGAQTALEVQVQRVAFHDIGLEVDTGNCIGLSGNTSSGIKIIENEFENCHTTWQTQGETNAEGFKLVGNTDTMALNYVTDCNGAYQYAGTNYGLAWQDAGPCQQAEGAGEFKGIHSAVGRVTARDEVGEVDANLILSRFPEDQVIGNGGSGGQGYGHSGGGNERRNILFRNGVSADLSNGGIPHIFGTGAVLEYQSVIGHIFYDLVKPAGSGCCGGGTARPFEWFTPTDATYQFSETSFNTLVDAPDGWVQRANNESHDYKCNLMIDSNGASGTAEADWDQDENYGYGDTTDLEAGDTDGGVVGNANMTDLVVTPRPYSNPNETLTIPGVLSTVNSPHLSACTGIGTTGRGVSDDAVTFP